MIWLYIYVSDRRGRDVVAARVQRRQQPQFPVRAIWDFLYRVTEPGLRPLRAILPNLGGIDISPVILIIALMFSRSAYRLALCPDIRLMVSEPPWCIETDGLRILIRLTPRRRPRCHRRYRATARTDAACSKVRVRRGGERGRGQRGAHQTHRRDASRCAPRPDHPPRRRERAAQAGEDRRRGREAGRPRWRKFARWG